MEYLNWEFTVLARAVAYSNLSSAAANIGLSQPQISRIVSKIEKDFGIALLDRDAKRKSSWTPMAYKFTELYASREAQFRTDITQLIQGSEPKHVRIACLDGLVKLVAQISHKLIQKTPIEILEVNIHDLNVLEERFLKGDYDFIFTSREPGKKKFSYRRQVGYQNLDVVGKGAVNVMSTFEFATQYMSKKHHAQLDQEAPTRTYVSNALILRQIWIEEFGGRGTIPSEVRQKKNSKEDVTPVWLIANEQISRKLWQDIVENS